MPPAADFLLIDIGNTSVKLRLSSLKRLRGATVRVPTVDLSPPALIRALGGWRYRRIILSSVAPIAAEVVASTLPERVLNVSGRIDCGVDLSLYPHKHALGSDRIADLAGALHLHGPGPLTVVDFGTAATFDSVDVANRFIGGVIAPGAEMLAGALHLRTAALPAVRLREPRTAVGRNTKDAMLAGAVYGWRGAVREILAALPAGKLIVTGGNAQFAAPALPADAIFERDLTFHGLRLIGERHFGDECRQRRSRRRA